MRVSEGEGLDCVSAEARIIKVTYRKVDMTRFSSSSFSSSLELDDEPFEDVVEPSSSELEVEVPFVSRVRSSSELVVDVCDPSELVVDVCED